MRIAVAASGIDVAEAKGYTCVSPEWPVTAASVRQTRAADSKTVPWAIDTKKEVRGAQAAGVGAVITSDPR